MLPRARRSASWRPSPAVVGRPPARGLLFPGGQGCRTPGPVLNANRPFLGEAGPRVSWRACPGEVASSTESCSRSAFCSLSLLTGFPSFWVTREELGCIRGGDPGREGAARPGGGVAVVCLYALSVSWTPITCLSTDQLLGKISGVAWDRG